MNTFTKWQLGTNGCYVSISNELSHYLEYALGKMEKQLHPKVRPLLDMRPYGKQIDEAFGAGYKVGAKAGMSDVKASHYKLGHDD